MGSEMCIRDRGDLDSVFAVSVLFLAPGTFVLSSEAFPAGIQLDLVG